MGEDVGQDVNDDTNDDTSDDTVGDAASGADAIEVGDNRAAGAFELRDAGRLIGIARYAVVPASEGHAERVVFFHTEVSKAYEGKGLAGRLAATALDETVSAGRTIVALCPYITAYLKRHAADYAGHVAQPQPADLEAVDQAVDG
ncbi:GNAT family N-acetyltransferase [Humibacillus xanthopallidus]|nr:GNAT family N-acetyltransferase [Humibacillus xanthopallidus]